MLLSTKRWLILCFAWLLLSMGIIAQNSVVISTLRNEITKSRELFGDALYSRPGSKTTLKKVAKVENPLNKETLTQYLFDPVNPKLEREVLRDYDGNFGGSNDIGEMEILKNKDKSPCRK